MRNFFRHLLPSLLGLRRRSEPWGVVYNSETKQPLDPAYLTLYDQKGNEVSSAMTDMDGRYGFHVLPGTYYIVAQKSHHRFPSKVLTGKKSDDIYDHLYFGGPIMVTAANPVIYKNIPLDPEDFDWNEMAKRDQRTLRFYSAGRRFLRKLTTVIFYLGFLVTILAIFITPYPLNLIIAFVYLLVAFVRRRFGARPTGRLIDSQKTPLPFARIRVLSGDGEHTIRTVSTDKYGEYYCLLNPGLYQLEVLARTIDGSYTPVHRTTGVNVKTGLLKEDIVVG